MLAAPHFLDSSVYILTYFCPATSIHPSVYLSIHLSIQLASCPATTYLSTYTSCVPTRLVTCRPADLPTYRPTGLPTELPTYVCKLLQGFCEDVESALNPCVSAKVTTVQIGSRQGKTGRTRPILSILVYHSTSSRSAKRELTPTGLYWTLTSGYQGLQNLFEGPANPKPVNLHPNPKSPDAIPFRRHPKPEILFMGILIRSPLLRHL